MSLTLTAVFFLTAAAFEIGFIDGARPDYKYINATRAWYKYHEERVSWHDASDTCRSERAVLFHPDSGDEAREVIAGLSVPAAWGIHSGFSDLVRADHYETVDGRALEQVYGNWSSDYPAYGSSQGFRCGVLRVRDLTLYVQPCDSTRPFICKEEADPALEDAQNTIANLTAKIADLERELANRTAVLKAMEEEAQATKIQDGNRIAVSANQTAALKDLEDKFNLKNQTTFCNGLDRITKALEQISKVDKNQVAALERISKAGENQAIILERLIQTTQQHAVNQSVAMDRLALAVEAIATNKQQ